MLWLMACVERESRVRCRRNARALCVCLLVFPLFGRFVDLLRLPKRCLFSLPKQEIDIKAKLEGTAR